MKNRKFLTSIFFVSVIAIFASCTVTKSFDTNSKENTITNNSKSTIIYVSEKATGENNGSSWKDAYNDIQDAIAQSKSGDDIWVAEGTYYASETDESVSFSLVDGTNFFGGFAGTETSISQRDLENHETILSGDIDKDGTTEGNTDNILLATNGIIDGFIIEDGYSSSDHGRMPNMAMGAQSDSSSLKFGPAASGNSNSKMGPPPMGGSAPSQTNTQDQGHSSPDMVTSGDAESTRNGAGIVIWGVSATIKNTTIRNCFADKGGGIYINVTSELSQQPLLYNVTVENCSSSSRGGGISIDMRSNPTFIDCSFIDNYCGGKGGGVYNDFGCSPRFFNCLFVGNNSEMASGIGNDGVSNSILYNCTFTENESSEQGAAVYQGTGPFNDPIIINSVISGNISENGQSSIFNWNESNTAVYNSVVEDGYNGTGDGVIDDVALFDSDYNCTNYELGYSSEDYAKRTTAEISQIVAKLYSVENTDSPSVLDLTNYSSAVAQDDVLYVSLDGNGDGSSYSNALSSIQDAIDMANNYYLETGRSVTINIEDGIYTPGNERSDSFILKAGANLVGQSESGTILSGEIGTSDAADNTYHVVIGSDNSSFRDLTISGGYADANGGEVYDRLGGGLLNYAAGNRVIPTYEPTLGFDTVLNNVTFSDNYAECGGAVYTYHGGNPTFNECTFTDNEALYGAATMEVGGCAAIYTDCIFTDNSASYTGGATFVDYGSLTSYYNCEFTDNNAESCGGATYVIDRASQSIINDTNFSSLIDSSWSNDSDIFSTAYFKNCTFENNSANNGSDLYAFEGSYIKIVNTDLAESAISISDDSHLIETSK
jgi:hypothetical protein